jgi:hypothetical protein
MKSELDSLHDDYVGELKKEISPEVVPLFYIQDKRQVVGNCVLWWRPNGQGYTTDLKDAGLYSKEKGRGLRDTDVLVPKELAESLAVTHVRLEALRDALETLTKKKS